MKYLKLSFILFVLSFFTSCNLLVDSSSYETTTSAFVEALKQDDFDTCISLMQLENTQGQRLHADTLRVEFDHFKKLLHHSFGEKPYEYNFVKWQKNIYSNQDYKDHTPPNTTRVFIEFNNGNELGVFQLLFDDSTNKILDIRTLDIKVEKPDIYLFWLSAIIPIIVLLFNLYVIREIKRSKLSKKWIKYLAVILLNVPSFTYAAIGGLTVNFLSFQLLLGVGFSGNGIIESAWTIGIPLGGLYWIWQLKMWK